MWRVLFHKPFFFFVLTCRCMIICRAIARMLCIYSAVRMYSVRRIQQTRGEGWRVRDGETLSFLWLFISAVPACLESIFGCMHSGGMHRENLEEIVMRVRRIIRDELGESSLRSCRLILASSSFFCHAWLARASFLWTSSLYRAGYTLALSLALLAAGYLYTSVSLFFACTVICVSWLPVFTYSFEKPCLSTQSRVAHGV